MRGWKLENEKDMQQERRLLKQYKKELMQLPRGSLNRYIKNGKVYYKHVTYMKGKDGKTRRSSRHLKKEDAELLYSLRRKAYLKEAVRRMTKNLTLQKKAAAYEPYDYYSIWGSLGEAYRFGNVEQFLRQEGIEISHVDKNGQTYRTQGLRQPTTGGFSARSKGETLIAEALMARGIVFQFEAEYVAVRQDGTAFLLHPDFKIPLRDGGVLLWEHLGLLSKSDYALDAGERLFFYNQLGFNPGANLILTADDKDGNTDMQAIARILDWIETVCLFH